MGETGGEKTHILTTSEIPSHHHNQQINANGGGANGAFTSAGATSPSGFQNMQGSSAPAVVTADTGGSGSHNNLQPYIALNYIIKI